MLKPQKFVIAASIFAMTAFLVSGERAEAITGNASARIAIPVTVSESTPLDHGTVTASGSLGTVTISSAGTRGVTGGVAELGGSPSQGIFAVTGEANSAFTTTVSASSTLTGAGADMVATLTKNVPANLTTGSATLNVSSSLAVAASQVAGAYSGTYTVTVNY